MLRNFNLLNVSETHADKNLQFNKGTGHEITSVLFRCKLAVAVQ